ncbi:MAG: hypothetical protein AAB703_06090, partial [Pseudomonadota bacterium]
MDKTPQALPTTINGDLLNLCRIRLIAFNIAGCPMILASSLRLLGKSMNEIPISMVSTPCPGKKSIRN